MSEETVTETATEAVTEAAPAEQTPAEPQVVSDWPDDWRVKIAGDNEKMQKYLDRFNSPADIAKSGLDFREKISRGEYKRAVAAPTDDEVAMSEWRAENGIPETADKYSVPEGVIFGEGDQPVVNEFLKKMHEHNTPDEYVTPALSWYADLQKTTLEHEAELAKNDKIQTEEALRAEWGHEYRANYAEVENFVQTRFPDIADALLSNPDTVKEMAAISREINPAVTLFPNSNNPNQSIDDEISSIESKMGTRAYQEDPKMQQRYQELLVAQSKVRR